MSDIRVIMAILGACSISAAQLPEKVDFGRDIQPLLREHCVECHGPSQQMRGLRLDRRRDALPNRVGSNGARIIPGDSARSMLVRRLSGTNAGPQMPPAGPLPEHQIKLIQAWIDQGAPWPDELSNDRSSVPGDAAVEHLRRELSAGNRGQFQRFVKAHPESVNARGQDGWTPLMYAAIYGNVEDCKLLLDRGAVVNARNDAGGTALMYAVDDIAKTKYLLDRGADPNLRSGEGRTALLIAAGISGSFPVMELLLERGANAKHSLGDGRGALALSAGSLDPRVLKLLLDSGAAPPVPLSAAVRSACEECWLLLLPHAQPRDLTAALRTATSSGNTEAIRKLLDAGAHAPPDILRAVALSPKPIPAAIIQEFLGRGADSRLKTSVGLTTVDFARRQGNDALVKILVDTGIRDESPAVRIPLPKPAGSVRAAVEKAIAPLQRADVAFMDRAGCVSCHNNSLAAMMVSDARTRGFRVNEQIASSQLKRIAGFLADNSERALEGEGLPGGIDTVSYILLGMAAEKYPSDVITDVWARYLRNNQSPDGRFKCLTARPPLESSDFEVTAASIRVLLAYAPGSHRTQSQAAVERAVHWLATAEPASTEDHVFQVLGLKWGGGSREMIRKSASKLLQLQRPDGGWGQLPALASDAYATGQALVALRESGLVKPNSVQYQRGVRYLLASQMEDGSWLVRTRSPSFQPYFDSDFPHGYDQFISAAASNWAVMSLLPAAATEGDHLTRAVLTR